MDQDQAAGQLRRQIAQATSEKEDVKLDHEALKRLVESHLLRLHSVLAGPEVSFERLSSAIQALDSELRGKLDSRDSQAGGTPGNELAEVVTEGLRDGLPAEGTYEVLRHSLSDAQRRCQELNTDMLRVADANEELHRSIKSLKGSNRRLVEEVQKQTEELSNLTQHRLQDMENLTRQEDAFAHDKALWAQEAQRCFDEEQARCDEEFCTMRDSLMSQLDSCWRRLAGAAAKAETLKAMQTQLRGEAQGFAQAFGSNLKHLEKQMLERITEDAKKMHAEQTELQDLQHGLQVKLRAEREVRKNETEAWRSRNDVLEKELNTLTTRRDREVSDLQNKIEAAIAKRGSEELAVKRERATLHDRVENSAKEVALLEAGIQTAKRKSQQLEARHSVTQGERERVQASAESLRQQIRASNEALDEAVHSNEALREQLEHQRLDCQSANERELKSCREMYEKRIDSQAQTHQGDQAELAKRVRSLEESVGLKAGKLKACQEGLLEKVRVPDSRAQVRDSLQKDVQMWKAQFELAAKMKADVEREFAHFRQESLGKELREKQEQHEELLAKQEELKDKKATLEEEALRLDREIQAREANVAQRTKSVADLRQEVLSEVERAKASLAEAESSLASRKAEASAAQQQMIERRDALEQELERLTADAEAEKRELERKIQVERAGAESLREAFERLRTEQRDSYKAAVEGPSQQIFAVEASISEIQQTADHELAGLRQRSEKLSLRSEELEGELSRLQAKLSHTELEVHEGTRRVNHTKENNRLAREALQKEKGTKLEELKQVQRSIAQKQERLRSSTQGGEDSRRRLLREIGEAKTSKAQQNSEASHRISAMKSEYSVALEDMDASRVSIVSRNGTSNGRMDSLLRENEDLKRCVSEHRLASSSLQDVGSQMQRRVASMEDRAVDMRRGLQ